MQKGLIPPQTNPETGEIVKDESGKVVLDYNMVIPNMLLHYFPSGMLGLGLTALLASFMSGMAGNVTAFNTVWTYDIFKAYIRRNATDANLLVVGQLATFFGVALSVAVAYFVAAFNNIMDVLQLVFAFVNAPLFATFLLGNVLETGDRARRILRPALRNGSRSGPSRIDDLCRLYPRGQGRLDRLGSHLPKPNGAEFLDCDLCLDRLLHCHDRDQPFYQAASRRRAQRFGLCADRQSHGNRRALVPAPGSSRDRCPPINPDSKLDLSLDNPSTVL